MKNGTLNCWEYKNCGRELNGINVKELGICPAATVAYTNNINEGVNGGRACWAIAGTFCGGKPQGTYTSKILNCLQCEFYKKVWKEQNDKKNYVETSKILKIINSNKSLF